MTARTAKRVLHDVLLLHSMLWAAWLYYAFALAPSPPERDWFVLREVAGSFINGDWASLYSDRMLTSGTHFFRYPPFVLYLIAPLAMLPPMASYALVCVVQFAAAGLALALLFRIRRPTELRLNVAAVLGSAAMCHVIVSGQNSALLALVIAALAACLASGRSALAGACVGLLACKPNWLPVFGALVLWRGGRRAVVAAALTASALALSTYPLGADVWQQFFGMTSRAAEIGSAYAAYREITLLAFLKSIVGVSPLTTMLWLGCLTGLVALVIRAVRDARSIGRSVALITLLAIVANPYASFYDGFILIVPATLWLSHRDQYPKRLWWIVGAFIGTYWLWDMTVFYYKTVVPAFADPAISLGGLLLTGWLVAEAVGCPDNSAAHATGAHQAYEPRSPMTAQGLEPATAHR